MKNKLMLIVNPHSGKMKVREVLFEIIDTFTKSNYETTVFLTQKKYDATDIIISHFSAHSNAYDMIVCCGGDGTLNETVNGIAKLNIDIPLGYIPLGTTNDFAATHNISGNALTCAASIMSGKDFGVDIGAFNNMYFTYIAAFGLFTSVSYTASQDMKKIFGPLAYVLEGIRQAAEIPVYRLTIEYSKNTGDEKTKIEDEFVFGMITNSTSIAGMIKLNESYVSLDDGKFEVMLIKNPPNYTGLAITVMGLTMQKYDEQYITYFQASQIKVTSAEPISWCIDGEDGGTHKEAVISTLPKRITLRA